VYTPTHHAYNKADPSGDFSINNVSFDINGTVGAVSVRPIIGANNIAFSMDPLYYTAINGSLKTNGFIE
jgi:hypothetical protein